MDPSRLWSLRKAYDAARRKLAGGPERDIRRERYDPIDVALAVGYRQGVAYARAIIEGVGAGVGAQAPEGPTDEYWAQALRD